MMAAITNGRVITPEGILDGYDVIIENEYISSIIPQGQVPESVESIDVTGAWVMPGLIDIHADFIESMAAPRPTSVMDLGLAFREAERILAIHGITTMFHSISFISNLHAFGTPIRAPELTRRLLNFGFWASSFFWFAQLKAKIPVIKIATDLIK